MSDRKGNRRDGFERLWPWPGNIFLVLFAAWAFYMGAIAELADVRTAFYGFGGVTLVVLVFGLRSVGRRPTTMPYRSARAAAGLDEKPSRTFREQLKEKNARLRTDEGGPAREAAVREVVPGVREFEVRFNREKAERGAQIVKLETTLGDRVAQLEQRLTAGVAADAPLDEFLRIDAFNAAVNERLLPRMADMIAEAIDTRASADGIDAPTSAGRDVAGTDGDAAGPTAKASVQGEPMSAVDVDSIRHGMAAIAARMDAVETAAAERLGEAERLLQDVRAHLSDLTERLTRIDDLAADVARRIDGIDVGASAEPDRTPADVAALREALSTIIAQNQEIRQQQDRLSARFTGAEEHSPDGSNDPVLRSD